MRSEPKKIWLLLSQETFFKVEPLAKELRGYGVSLEMASVWQIRQTRLHQDISQSGVLEFNLKLDGRHLAGIQ